MADSKAQYESVKREILAAIAEIRKEMPNAAEYLLQHLHMDDEKFTFMYDGDPSKFRMWPAYSKEPKP